MHPIPDHPAPEGWVYITHPDVGVSDAPVSRQSLGVWAKAGWSPVEDDADVPVTGAEQPTRRVRPVTDAKEL